MTCANLLRFWLTVGFFGGRRLVIMGVSGRNGIVWYVTEN